MLDPTLEAEGLGRSAFSEALEADWAARRAELAERIGGTRLLVLGAAGTIGAAMVRQLLELGPARIELVDLDENGLARLARDIRSRGAAPRTALGFNALDFAAPPGLAFAAAEGPFDLVLNFAAVKHVRSEKNPFTLLHMLGVNVVSQQRFAEHLRRTRLAGRYFVVSTDKAADPASFMGATKHLMEQLVFAEAAGPGAPLTSAARFANVAYSSGSLLESYLQRFAAGQALAAPRDTRRYFISARDGARVCLLGALVCGNARIAAPKFDPASGAIELAETAERFLQSRGRTAVFVDTPEAAAVQLARGGAHPVLLTPRDTAGEKEVEVFRGQGEIAEDIGLKSLEALRPAPADPAALNATLGLISAWVAGAAPTPDFAEVEAAIRAAVPSFAHLAGEATLDDRI
jgi:nucleoside-diphosphate-sugar epimerase